MATGDDSDPTQPSGDSSDCNPANQRAAIRRRLEAPQAEGIGNNPAPSGFVSKQARGQVAPGPKIKFINRMKNSYIVDYNVVYGSTDRPGHVLIHDSGKVDPNVEANLIGQEFYLSNLRREEHRKIKGAFWIG